MVELTHRFAVCDGTLAIVEFQKDPGPVRYGAKIVPLGRTIEDPVNGVANCKSYREAYDSVLDYLFDHKGCYVELDRRAVQEYTG